VQAAPQWSRSLGVIRHCRRARIGKHGIRRCKNAGKNNCRKDEAEHLSMSVRSDRGSSLTTALRGAGDVVARQSLEFYDALGGVMAVKGNA
jgi:hypothetical protein